jgi:hypothetical protein
VPSLPEPDFFYKENGLFFCRVKSLCRCLVLKNLYLFSKDDIEYGYGFTGMMGDKVRFTKNHLKHKNDPSTSIDQLTGWLSRTRNGV